VLAAICSLAGFSLMIGWEYSVAKPALSGVMPEAPPFLISLYVFSIVVVTLAYTMIGGLRSQKWADLVQNILKGIVFIGLLIILADGFRSIHIGWGRVLPPFSTVIQSLGWVGLITNVLFSVVWQFVDMSTWQTAISTSKELGPAGVRKALRTAGILTFIAPGVLGTAIGLLIPVNSAITSDNIFTHAIQEAGGGPLVLAIMCLAIIMTVMSFVDGLLLAASYTIATDLFFAERVESKGLLQASDNAADELRKARESTPVLTTIRLGLILVAAFGTIGISAGLDFYNLTLFDALYFVIVSQLALLGAILSGLIFKALARWTGTLSIVAGLSCGLAAACVGLRFPDWHGLYDGAGVISGATSSLVALALARVTR